MKNKFKVACFQTSSSDIPEENITMLEKIFSNFKEKSVDLICLPECVSIFTDSKKLMDDYINNWHHIFLEFIKNKSREVKSYILIGSYPYKKIVKNF